MNILVTGCAGFIGFHICKKLLKNNKYKIIGIDNLNEYYDINLKQDRLKILKENKKFIFKKLDLTNKKKLLNLVSKNKIKYIINLAAQAGVRYSILNPNTYFENNILGFYNILEVSRLNKIKHLIFASTSSVYGDLKTYPLKEEMNTDRPLSFYAATKKTNEIMAHSYCNIYKLPITGLRFFTVYGPYGRPDMSLFLFVKSILQKRKIKLFNSGNHIRDFTYIDDVVSSIEKLLLKSSRKTIPYQIFNIASGNPINLKKFIKFIENKLGILAKTTNHKLQLGDVIKTHGDITKLKKINNIKFSNKIEQGISKFIIWYKKYYINK